jgi:hypothetical protein
MLQAQATHTESGRAALAPTRVVVIGDRVRVPGYTTEMYCAFCEARTEFLYVV